MSFAVMMLIGLGLDAMFGWPNVLYRRLSHPVVWLGKVISFCEARFNSGAAQRRLAMGAITVVLTVLCAFVPAALIQRLLPDTLWGIVLGGVLVWPLLALRSLHDHVAAIAEPLASDDIDNARRALSMIVGRDPSRLDAPGIARAGIESLAENSSDGVSAPLFWGVLFGLPGIAVYKAINTMDSMIGYRSDRYEHFGKLAARLDDLANWVPARLTALAIAFASGLNAHKALRCVRADASLHRSPNAGWPEAAMAGALGIRLSGPRVYDTGPTQDPFVNAGSPDPSAADMRRALTFYLKAMGVFALAIGALALF